MEKCPQSGKALHMVAAVRLSDDCQVRDFTHLQLASSPINAARKVELQGQR